MRGYYPFLKHVLPTHMKTPAIYHLLNCIQSVALTELKNPKVGKSGKKMFWRRMRAGASETRPPPQRNCSRRYPPSPRERGIHDQQAADITPPWGPMKY